MDVQRRVGGSLQEDSQGVLERISLFATPYLANGKAAAGWDADLLMKVKNSKVRIDLVTDSASKS